MDAIIFSCGRIFVNSIRENPSFHEIACVMHGGDEGQSEGLGKIFST